MQAKSLDPTEAATAANNLQQARKAYYSNLEWRAYAAQQELEEAGKGSWLASMSGQELYERGYLTQQEAQDLQAMRRETLAAAVCASRTGAGAERGGSTAGQKIQSVAEEAKASALGGAQGAANATTSGLNVGATFGKLGTVVENPGVKIGGLTEHGIDQVVIRGVSPVTLKSTMDAPVAVFKQSSGRYLYVSEQAAVVVTPNGKIVMTYPSSMFDTSIQGILKAAGK